MLKERYGNGVDAFLGGTNSRLAISIQDGRYVNIKNNKIYGVVDLEPDATGHNQYHIVVEGNHFHSGPITPQAAPAVGSYHHDEIVLAPGASGTAIDGAITLNGIAAAPLIGEITLRDNQFERGLILTSVDPYVAEIINNKFNEGLIILSNTAGVGVMNFTNVSGNSTKFPYPGQTTFIRLDGLSITGTFMNNIANIPGGYVIASTGPNTGDAGRNVFAHNFNRSATAAGVFNFEPLRTSIAIANWHNALVPFESPRTQRMTFTRDHVGSERTVNVPTDCTLSAGAYICDYIALAADSWILTSATPVAIKQITNMELAHQLTLRSTDTPITADITLQHSQTFVCWAM